MKIEFDHGDLVEAVTDLARKRGIVVEGDVAVRAAVRDKQTVVIAEVQARPAPEPLKAA